MLKKLNSADMDIARLSFSHGDQAGNLALLKKGGYATAIRVFEIK